MAFPGAAAERRAFRRMWSFGFAIFAEITIQRLLDQNIVLV
ncbi:MAG TPA: hypothetical protein VKB21_05525 [Candidatus Acidoferrum sp.]|nr:hypothetical protein [Candidatus Acidoferrum sp.]